MMRIDKMEAFSLAVKFGELNDNKTANELMRIISKSIEEEKKNRCFSQYIEITNKKDEKFIRKILGTEGGGSERD